jgi:hypothetical protein
MSELAIILLELAESTAWGDLHPSERALFEEWAKNARGQDVAMLLWEAHRRWRRPRKSSSTTFSAVREQQPSSPPPAVIGAVPLKTIKVPRGPEGTDK